MRHTLKSWPPYFEATLRGDKTFDVRFDDRNYQVGDEVELVEWEPRGDRATSRRCVRRVVYVLREEDAVRFGLQPGHVVLGLSEDAPW